MHGVDFELRSDFDLGWLGVTHCICTGFVSQKLGEPAYIDFMKVEVYLMGKLVDVTNDITESDYDTLESSCLIRICGLANEKGTLLH